MLVLTSTVVQTDQNRGNLYGYIGLYSQSLNLSYNTSSATGTTFLVPTSLSIKVMYIHYFRFQV